MKLAAPIVKHLFADQEDVVRLKVFHFYVLNFNEYREKGDMYSIKENNWTSFVCSFGYTLKFYNAFLDFVWILWKVLLLPGCMKT